MAWAHRSWKSAIAVKNFSKWRNPLNKTCANCWRSPTIIRFCFATAARAQFAAVPMNLLEDTASADYIDGGYWAHSAIKEAQKYCDPRVIDVTTEIDGLGAIKPMRDWALSADGAYVHYCPNETIDGLAIDELPNFGDRVVVADFSSTILSHSLDVSHLGVIYAGAQKKHRAGRADAGHRARGSAGPREQSAAVHS